MEKKSTRFTRILGEDVPASPAKAPRKARKKAEAPVLPVRDERSLYPRVTDGDYQSKVEFSVGLSREERTRLMDERMREEGRLLEQFKNDLLTEFGMVGHPKADLLYSKAWEHGHAAGLFEVIVWFDDLLELVQ